MTAKRKDAESNETPKRKPRGRAVSNTEPSSESQPVRQPKQYKDFSKYADEIEETFYSSDSNPRPEEDEARGKTSFGEGIFDDESDSGYDFSSSRKGPASDSVGESDSDSDADSDSDSDRSASGDDYTGDYTRRRESIWNRNPFQDANGSFGQERNYRQERGDAGQDRYRRDDRPAERGGERTGDRGPDRFRRDDRYQDRYRRDDSRQDDRGGYRQDDRGSYRNDERGGYRQDDRGGYRSDERGGYRQDDRGGYRNDDRGGYRQDNRGGYRNDNRGYRQDNRGGYRQDDRQPRPYRQQERFYRRHFRDGEGNYTEGADGYRSGGYQDRYNPYRRYQNPGYTPEMLENMEPETAPRGKYGEPLSLAEELASARFRGKPDEPTVAETISPEEIDQLGTPEDDGKAYFARLQAMTAQELVQEARRQNVEDIVGERRTDFIFRILNEKIKKSGLMYGEGTLEILPDEFGFLRNPEFHYLSCPDDIYISPSQIRRFGLRNGSTVFGQIRPPKEKERYFALLRIEAINQEDPNVLASKPFFDDLTAMHPNERIMLETPDGDMNTRVVDMIIPVGFGQRGLIVSPPRAGKTILMQKMARSVLANYPNAYVFMLLIDERPEEVTDMERQVKGPRCEVISSTFDEPPARHIQVSEMVLDKAKRMVEYGKDVVIFLDSMTRLARAWNNECPTSGKTLSGGIDAGALQSPKKFFGAARKVEEGGSLTIIATALVDTGSRMDEVIFEEFKGTGNLEIWLDRTLVDKRIWPAIDITRSGTRREEMILDPEEYKRITILRRILNDMNPPDAMEFLTDKLAKTKTNAEFLMSLNVR